MFHRPQNSSFASSTALSLQIQEDMQTPKTRSSSVELQQKTSPSTPRTARHRTPDSCSVPNRSPKVSERRSPRSPVVEKKRQSKVVELETQVCQLKEELKKAKEQFESSELRRKKAELEAEEAKKTIVDLHDKLEESHQQYLDLSASEDARVQEMGKISQDRDRAWQSELEAVHEQHSINSAALASAMNEIQKLKLRLDMANQSESALSANTELQKVRKRLTETLAWVDELKEELASCKTSEAHATVIVDKTKTELQSAKSIEEALQADRFKHMETCNSLAVQLESSNSQVRLLEKTVEELKGNLVPDQAIKHEFDRLNSALDAAEMKYQEEYIQNVFQYRTALESMEEINATLKNELIKAEAEIHLLQSISRENDELIINTELDRENDLMIKLKANLIDKEMELQSVKDENESLKFEIEKQAEANRDNLSLVSAARAAKEEALLKVNSLIDEADKTNRRAERTTEDLDVVQAANSDLQAELRKLKVQLDQWRKAAEAATAMISSGNCKFIERTGSLDNSFQNLGQQLGSLFAEEMEDDSIRKKNGNVLRKFGVLWKKGQK